MWERCSVWCVCDVHVCRAQTHRQQGKASSILLYILHLILLKQDLSLNLEIGWQPVSPSDPLVSALQLCGLRLVSPCAASLCYWPQDLVLVQQHSFPLSELSLQSWLHPLLKDHQMGFSRDAHTSHGPNHDVSQHPSISFSNTRQYQLQNWTLLKTSMWLVCQTLKWVLKDFIKAFITSWWSERSAILGTRVKEEKHFSGEMGSGGRRISQRPADQNWSVIWSAGKTREILFHHGERKEPTPPKCPLSHVLVHALSPRSHTLNNDRSF